MTGIDRGCHCHLKGCSGVCGAGAVAASAAAVSGSMARRTAGFVLTIESDDEDAGERRSATEADEEPIDDEEEEEDIGPNADAEAVAKKASAQASGKPERVKGGLFWAADGFESGNDEDDDDDEDGGVVQESWDFTKTIEEIRSREHPAQRLTTSLDFKIKKSLADRARRQAAEELAKELGKPVNEVLKELEKKTAVDGAAEDSEASASSAAEDSAADELGDESDAGSELGDSESGEEDGSVEETALAEADSDGENEAEELVGDADKTITALDDELQSKLAAVDRDDSRQLGVNSQILKNKLKKEVKIGKMKQVKLTFAELNLSRPLIRATQALGFDRPTPIQAKAIPFALAGRDICGSAVTGSGKTAAFVLPVLERLLFRPQQVMATRVLIVTPTRELTQQVHSMVEKLSQFTNISSAAIVGGLAMGAQAQELRGRPDVVVATPGRLIDHVRNSRSVDLDDVEILVLDEADRLLELGFLDEVKELVNLCPKSRQTMLFSATMTTSVNQLAELSLSRAVRIQADPLYDMANRLVQEFVRVKDARERDRPAMLMALCTRSFKEQVIIFVSRKHVAHRFGIIFGLFGLRAAELHGNLTQAQRLEALQRFRDGDVDYLICTDLASRGLDISGVSTVINYEMPRDLSTYVHRVGRTARAGRGGVAVTLTGEQQRKLTKEVLKRSKHNVKSRSIPDAVIDALREKIDDFQPEIENVLEQERIEKEVRLAEMEASKAGNLVKHRDEILARPQKTWFQSERQRQQVREAAKAQVAEQDALNDVEGKNAKERRENRRALKREMEKGGSAEEEKRPHRLTRKKRRRLEAQKEQEREMRRSLNEEKERAAAEGRTLDDDTVRRMSQPLEARARVGAHQVKRKIREREERAGTAPISKNDLDLERFQLKSNRGKKRIMKNANELAKESVGKVARRARLADASNLPGFDFELGPRGSAIDRRDKQKSKGNEDALVFKEMDLTKGGLRKGGKKGNNRFKSKSRFKRR